MTHFNNDLQLQLHTISRGLFSPDIVHPPPIHSSTYLIPVVIFVNHDDLEIVSPSNIDVPRVMSEGLRLLPLGSRIVVTPTVVSLHHHTLVAASLYHAINYEVHVDFDERRRLQRTEAAVVHSMVLLDELDNLQDDMLEALHGAGWAAQLGLGWEG